MEVSDKTIDDLFEIIDSLIKENTQLKNRLQIANRIQLKYLYDKFENFDSYTMIKEISNGTSIYK